MKFVYPFITFMVVAYPYERTVTRLRIEKNIKIHLFAISIYGATVVSAFILKLAFCTNLKYACRNWVYDEISRPTDFFALAVFYLKVFFFPTNRVGRAK